MHGCGEGLVSLGRELSIIAVCGHIEFEN